MPDSLSFAIENNTNSLCYVYLTGCATQHDSARCFLRSDGSSLYFPTSPEINESHTNLQEDCAIPVAPNGGRVSLQVPQLSGGRVWLSRNDKIAFFLDPGSCLVEPSVSNMSDENAQVDFSFVEFTLNDKELYANISYVDFVSCLPISLKLRDTSGHITNVRGLPADGSEKIAEGLSKQSNVDGYGWADLVMRKKDGHEVLRILNPTHADTVGARFDGYFEPYVAKVWKMYDQATGCKLSIDTQSPAGVLTGCVNSAGLLDFGPNLTFTQPNTADILGCNSGPFIIGRDKVRNALIPRLAAGFVRSTLLCEDYQPCELANFYQNACTHHYSRCVHEANIDGKGYAFAYDDVDPKEGIDQSGRVNSGDPAEFTIILGC